MPQEHFFFICLSGNSWGRYCRKRLAKSKGFGKKGGVGGHIGGGAYGSGGGGGGARGKGFQTFCTVMDYLIQYYYIISYYYIKNDLSEFRNDFKKIE